MKKIYTIVMMAAALAACNQEELPQIVEEPEAPTYTMIIEATKGEDDNTKALSLSGKALNATWAEGEAVTVYNVTRSADLSGTLTAQSSGTSTVLKGTLTGTIQNGDQLKLMFCSPSYASQTGTLEYIAANCDYAEATTTVSAVADGMITASAASFVNQQAIVKFTLKNKATNAAINATQLVIGDGSRTFTVTPTSATSEIFVALPSFSNKTITLTTTDGDDNYIYEKSGVTFNNSQYYEITVKMATCTGTEDAPYLITSVADWNNLATKVNNGNNFSGKFFRLTADIDVTTMVGNSESNSFMGTFDGNGHTLNISYNTTSDYTAPFRYIQGATFKNLKVTGSITTTMNLAAGIAGLNTGSSATFDQCVTDITINSTSSTLVGWGKVDYHGGLLARTTNKDVTITDCVCSGTVNASSSTNSNCASFVGVAENCTVHATRCISTTSYTNVYCWNSLCHSADAERDASVFYYLYADDTANVGEQVTSSQLADGSYATALQAGRSTTVWVQDATINQPMLKLFAHN